MIVLKENEWAKKMIDESRMGNRADENETLRRVARYYLDSGYDRDKVRAILDTFLLKCDPSASLVKWSDRLDDAVSLAVKRDAVYIEDIPITAVEMSRIKQLNRKQSERIAFVLLCLAKYWNAVNRENAGWVFNRDSEVMALANVNAPSKRQWSIYRKLSELGMIQLSKRIDSLSVKVCFMEQGEVVMRVTTFKDLGYQYSRYLGERFDECEVCGGLTRVDPESPGRKRRYCKQCAERVAAKNRQRVAALKKSKQFSRPPEYTVYMHEDPEGKRYVGVTMRPLCKTWGNGAGYLNNSRFNVAIAFYGWNNIRHFVLEKTLDPARARNVAGAYMNKYDTTNSECGYNKFMVRHEATNYDEIIRSCYPVEVKGDGITNLV